VPFKITSGKCKGFARSIGSRDCRTPDVVRLEAAKNGFDAAKKALDACKKALDAAKKAPGVLRLNAVQKSLSLLRDLRQLNAANSDTVKGDENDMEELDVGGFDGGKDKGKGDSGAGARKGRGQEDAQGNVAT